MNLARRMHAASRLVHSIWLRCRTHLPRQQSFAFGPSANFPSAHIGPVYVINLQRQPERWAQVLRELGCILDAFGTPLSERAVRYSACDAQAIRGESPDVTEIVPYYTLGDQLFVEPQPHALPDEFDLSRPIKMSPAEVAVARSHIGVWKAIAESTDAYALVIEDDVWFERGFGRIVDQAWREIRDAESTGSIFDVLYTSYGEARYGAPKEWLSESVFRPERGLWFLSGYILSKRGAQRLLGLLPCRGPVDLWINHKFREIDVRSLRRSVINQRRDLSSTNSYSILPTLNRIGVLDCDAGLFHQRPPLSPVFVFGKPGSGFSSLAMALSMLGYCCCSNLDRIPDCEFEKLIAGQGNRAFNAYVNIGSLTPHVSTLRMRFPKAKFIVIDDVEGRTDDNISGVLGALDGADILWLRGENLNKWGALCEHVRLAPPIAPYPSVYDMGQRKQRQDLVETPERCLAKHLRHDPSPWIVQPYSGWTGINAAVTERPDLRRPRTCFEDDLSDVQSERWLLRSDTFAGNLALFRPSNVTEQSGGGVSLAVIQESLGVRDFSAAAISSRDCFLYGRFEAMLRATNVPGLVTGFFLHRDSPRQEIDIEITGNHPTRLLLNVFYNPGGEGAKFDYGYRGTPTAIPLGFDASKALHRYAIEWDPCEIRWFVDGTLVYRRAEWHPTPIPHLPMTLHVNTWPSRSRELAGRLAPRALPASATVRNIAVNALNGKVRSDGTQDREISAPLDVS